MRIAIARCTDLLRHSASAGLPFPSLLLYLRHGDLAGTARPARHRAWPGPQRDDGGPLFTRIMPSRTALTEWLGVPVPGWARVGPVIRIEDFVAEGRYVVRADVPGIDPGKDVDVRVGNGLLTISAQRSEETSQRHRSEFRYGSCVRTVRLPPGADEDDVTASYKNGVLEVSVGLAADTPTGRQITVEQEADSHDAP